MPVLSTAIAVERAPVRAARRGVQVHEDGERLSDEHTEADAHVRKPEGFVDELPALAVERHPSLSADAGRG